ncbi:acetyl-CoA carboxylase biotin carboxylase subunit [Niveispirillum sp.]|uniref:acetyl-CoA carboxylase biotin carboxylase subunit n=1 Tax=Niveispirillum sp. TaxID=1917217 RepID=UPI001B5A4C29|nr:acetyl-CoA carboxylase biotin carboxylase subunit [Niveispirillum sp.]MBP7334267.1 acetyl-CoA carboxylase biotin carboxylase subunit [Niveispirillum sp.]
MTSPTPFSKILIANRGEIALRVIRTAHALGYKTVAVYSTADAQAAHVIAADQAVCIGEPLPSQSYLRIPAIIEAARASGADAIHPGYGFLAENEEFAAACRDAGLVFIGPSPEAIRAMGDKAGGKRLMIAAGVPCIQGYQGDDQSEQRLSQEAERIGYPVMIKATAGGGGRGMRLVPSAAEFADLLRSAQSEARNAFGDATVILERAIVEPRHVEIQIFADRHGNAVHLGERDCSVQRRHQKVVEEAPSPAVDAGLRARMGAAAVTAAKAIAYEGAGTLEFLLDRDGNYYFMEMNTRLQVEHPVTEAVTGLDLVEWQLRVAAGEPLPMSQDDIRFSGHAIEVRLCAEDVRAGFMPQSGTMRRWQAPSGLRVEHGLRSGSPIPPFYDSMIAKLIAHGASRDEARRRLIRGIEEMVALGVRTNQEFLARCLSHPVFAAGDATTAFIAQQEADLIPADEASTTRAAIVGAWLLQETTAAGRHAAGDRSLAHAMPLGLRFALDGKRLTASISQVRPQQFTVKVDGTEHALDVVAIGKGEGRFILNGVMDTVAYDRDGPSLWLRLDGRPYVLDDLTRAAASRTDEGGGDGRVRASMNGRVVAVMATVGDRVSPGQPLLALEAMKMEHVHTAPVQGVITGVMVAIGDQVQAQRVMVEITPDAPQGAAA